MKFPATSSEMAGNIRKIPEVSPEEVARLIDEAQKALGDGSEYSKPAPEDKVATALKISPRQLGNWKKLGTSEKNAARLRLLARKSTEVSGNTAFFPIERRPIIERERTTEREILNASVESLATWTPGERGVTELDPKTGKTTRKFIVRDGKKKPE